MRLSTKKRKNLDAYMHLDVGRDVYAGVRKVAQQQILYCSRLLCGARRTQTSIAVC